MTLSTGQNRAITPKLSNSKKIGRIYTSTNVTSIIILNSVILWNGNMCISIRDVKPGQASRNFSKMPVFGPQDWTDHPGSGRWKTSLVPVQKFIALMLESCLCSVKMWCWNIIPLAGVIIFLWFWAIHKESMRPPINKVMLAWTETFLNLPLQVDQSIPGTDDFSFRIRCHRRLRRHLLQFLF